MEVQISFWKKYEYIIVAAATLLLIYGVVFFNQKISYFLGNDLVLYVTPNQEFFSLDYGSTGMAKFDVSIDNVAYCKSACSYSFNDRSRNEILDKGSFSIMAGEHFIKNYNLSVKRHGSGEDIYSFDMSCHNLHSFVCLTESPEKYRSSLIAVTYDLTGTEKELKKKLKQNLMQLLVALADADSLHKQVNQKYFELSGSINIKNISKEKIIIDNDYDSLRISIENLENLWSSEDYIKLNQTFNRDFLNAVNDIKNLILNFDNDINTIARLHNNLLLRLNRLSNNINQLNIILRALGNNETQVNRVSGSIVRNDFDSYLFLENEISNITSRQNLIASDAEIPAAALFFNTAFILRRENDLLCSLKQDCNGNISVAGVIKDAENFLDNYPSTANLRQACTSLANLSNIYSGVRNETLSIIAGRNITFPSDDKFSSLAEQFKENEIRTLNNSYYISSQDIKNATNPDIANIASLALPKSLVGMKELNYNKSINISLYLLSTINADESPQLKSSCLKINENKEKIADSDFEPVDYNITYLNITRINTILPENPPVCCVFNECSPCCKSDSCRNDTKTFPIVFVHGHSFAEDNSPEYSLEAFNKLQSIMQEDGYLNAGIVSIYSKNDPLQEGMWSFSGQPVTVKISYYYDALKKENKYIVIPTKSEDIDTYALRLRDLINIIKERTNKPKVDIIAHSMGGLVARRYIQIFGAQDVDKLIMIATPNNGISGRAATYCSYVGGSRECSDMLENSLFINKLNDPLNQPDKIKLYAIVGRGCNTDGKDGDEIVPTESARLESAEIFYVNGTCAGIFGATFHTDILNINKYPETYNIIKEILNK